MVDNGPSTGNQKYDEGLTGRVLAPAEKGVQGFVGNHKKKYIGLSFKHLSVVFGLMLLLLSGEVLGQTINSNINWSAISPTPTSNSAIIISNNAIVTVDVSNAVCLSIQIGLTSGSSNSNTGTLTFSGLTPTLTAGSITI